MAVVNADEKFVTLKVTRAEWDRWLRDLAQMDADLSEFKDESGDVVDYPGYDAAKTDWAYSIAEQAESLFT